MIQKHDDLETFLSAKPSTPPRWVGDELSASVRRDLEPGWARVLSKVLGIHVVSSIASLWLCPQFGVELRSGAGSVLDF